ncbi:hypothetical protein LGL55_17835 [Clostridium tagluense]|uniref:hypothetical protein n=1 Tax=Clostridium tagluense TaxID=360422 RepID=UPI001C0B0CEC|nr:hypothetical protein [Clostridium tagluense]MBU3128807.1 hypothetical protein [Clostridium tagluense]MCB2313057.1 hypothetical protein [Clostridium tagluense]MCB2317834.1 hypothetical protein [Clostridium tagluense]MCB2322619.1 hypothetical protein [Clostridium tagluense]MCB2327606.1 hypothetical protein [Clostridium tagluense]
MQLKGSNTEKNLLSTFVGESRARNKNFDATANNEKAHAREVFNRFLKMNKTTADNLKKRPN